MTNNLFKHHSSLETVALEDVRFVKEKDISYGASWKKRGGVGAAMMLARKWDRLETMLAGTASRWDIFELIEKDPSGKDGCALAEIRDLRRYLLLVEAEMMARGVVKHTAGTPSADKQLGMVLMERAAGAPSADKQLEMVLEEDRCVPRYTPAVQIEDSSRHAVLTPWVVNVVWRMRNDLYTSRLLDFERWWRRLAPAVWVLEPFIGFDQFGELEIQEPPKELINLYRKVENGFLLNIEDCPSDVRDFFPHLKVELNGMELEMLSLEWVRKLYVEKPTKWVLDPLNIAWV